MRGERSDHLWNVTIGPARALATVALLALTLAPAACSDSGATTTRDGSDGAVDVPGDAPADGVSAGKRFAVTIDGKGGVVATDDDAVRVLIPPGALDTPTEVAIVVLDINAVPGSSQAVGGVIYRIEPEGRPFARDVAASMAQRAAPPSGQHLGVARYDTQAGAWKEVSSTLIDGRVVALTSGFSNWAAFYYQGQPSLPITQVRVAPASLRPQDQQWSHCSTWCTSWTADARTVTISGRTSPDGTGSWSDRGSGQSGAFTVSGGTFSFSYTLPATNFAYPVLSSPGGSGYFLELWCGAGCGQPPDGAMPDSTRDGGTDGAMPDTRIDGGAPAVTPVWVKGFPDNSTTPTFPGIAACPDGSIWITGDNYGQIDFGGGPIGINSDQIFLVGFNADGSHRFSKVYNGTGGDRATAIACDANNRVYIAGSASSMIDFSDNNSQPLSNTSLVVAVFKTDGSHVMSFGYTGLYANAIAPAANGAIVIAGAVQTGTTVPGLPTFTQGGLFIGKYAAGSWTFAVRSNSGAALDSGSARAVALDSAGDIYVAGEFGPTTTQDGFVAKFSGTNGAHVWNDTFGFNKRDTAIAIAVDKSTDSVYAAGSFGSGTHGIFFKKYSKTGAAVWEKTFGAPGGGDYASAVAVDSAGNVYLAGVYTNNQTNFGGGVLPHFFADEWFTAKFSASGAHLWSVGYATPGYQLVYGIAVDAQDRALVLGETDVDTMSFGPSITLPANTEFAIVKYP
ncbi:MAG: SBBP repeat-containing protein [Myxococcales bacterium]|nr:SBBP repeat-containing protein [Myxococcales bacterium]